VQFTAVTNQDRGVDVPEQRQPRKRPDAKRPDGKRPDGKRPDGKRPEGKRPERDGSTGGRPAGKRPDAKSGERRKDGDRRRERPTDRPYSRTRDGERRDGADRNESQRAYDGPPIPEHITGRELDRSVQAQLQSLPDKLALRVARHLVAAGELIDTEPKTAYQHTLAARGRAGRLAVVREAVGEAAYAAGEYAEALAELRAARRMNGAQDYVAMMADCERALGRSDRALTLIKNAPKDKLSTAVQAELVIVEAGARRDRGELDAALRTLENAPLLSKSREPWVARLRYAYADTLVAAGRLQDALTWFHRTEAVDVEEQTDAGERAAQIEREQ
jgi:tetratricopeptide (TPR) repeat protein